MSYFLTILYFIILIGILLKLNKIITKLDIITKQNDIVIKQNHELQIKIKEINKEQ